MDSKHGHAVLVTIFKAITFAPLIVVGLIILITFGLALLDAWSWLSYQLHEYRAERRIDDALAHSVENGMVDNRVLENGMIK